MDETTPEIQEKLSTPRETGARWRRWLRVLLIVLALLLIIRLAAGWITQSQLNNRLAEISAAGHPVRLSELSAPELSPDDGWPLFEQLIRRAEAQGLGAAAREHELARPPSRQDIDRDQADAAMLDDFSQGPPRSDQLVRSLQARLDQLYPLLADLAEASNRSTVTWPITQSSVRPFDVPMAALLRLMSFLHARATLEFAEGRSETGAADVLTLIRLANQFAQMPFLLGVGLEARSPESAWRALQEGLPACGHLPADLREQLRAALAGGATGDRLRHGTIQARALSQTLFEDIAGGRLDPSTLYGQPAEAGWAARVHVWFIRPLLARDQYNTLGSYEQFLAVIDKTYWELDRPTEEIVQIVQKKAGGLRRTVHTLDSANSRMLYSLVRYQAIDRTARVLAATALELQYWRTEHGRWSDDLSVITGPGGQLPVDPLTGRPLGYRAYDTPLLYSAGLDLADNAGTFDAQKDIFGQSGNDMVFLLGGVPEYAWRPKPSAGTQPATVSRQASQPASATTLQE